MVESFKVGNQPAGEVEVTIKDEIDASLRYLGDLELRFKAYEKSDDTPIKKNIKVSNYFDYLALESEPHDMEPFIPNTVKNKYAYWNKVRISYKMRLLKDYEFFLQGILREVFDITQSPEYWQMRKKNICNPNITQGEPPEASDVKSFPKPDNVGNHILMQRLKTESPITYKAMCKALDDKFITFDQSCFDFHCDRGCVGLFFREGGFTEYKTLRSYVLIKGNPPAATTLENCTRNSPPKSWQTIKKRYFDTPTK
jgi:hypothetical protein